MPKPYWAMNSSSDRPGAVLSASMPSLTRAKSTGTYSNPAAVMQSPIRPSTCSTLLASSSIVSPNSSEPKLGGSRPRPRSPEPETAHRTAAATLMPAASPRAPSGTWETSSWRPSIRIDAERHLIGAAAFSGKSASRPHDAGREPSQIATIVVVAVVLSSLGGWVAGSRIRSPAEIAAQTAAPDASPILVPAEERTVATTVVTRGTGRFGTPQTLTTSPTALEAVPGIVTNVPAPGTEIAEGGVVMTATGRPVFLLAGDRLGIHDLGPGLQGEDVRQLEQALARLGFDPGPVDGVYDAGTEAAVARWYESGGVRAVPGHRGPAGDDPVPRVRPGHGPRRAWPTPPTAPPPRAATWRPPRRRYADAARHPGRQPGGGGRGAGPGRRRQPGRPGRRGGQLAALDELLAAPDSTPGAIAAARADLAAAQAGAESVRLAGEKAVADANVAAAQADNAVASTDAAVRTAQQRVAIAQSVDRRPGGGRRPRGPGGRPGAAPGRRAGPGGRGGVRAPACRCGSASCWCSRATSWRAR